MRPYVGAIAMVLSLFASRSAMAADDEIRVDKFTVGPWNGGAYDNEKTGEFSHCGAYRPAGPHMGMLIRLDRDFLISMAVTADDWQFPEQASYVVTLKADNRPLGQFEAKPAPGDRVMDIIIGQDNRVYEAIRMSRLFTIEAEQGKFSFIMADADRAFLMVRRCVEARLGLIPRTNMGRRNPFVPGGWGTPAGLAENLGDRIMTWETAATMLRGAGLSNVKRRFRTTLQSSAYFWDAGRFAGLGSTRPTARSC